MNDNLATKNVIDSSGEGNDGTAQQNTEDLHTTGKINGALTFNGTSDRIDIGAVGIFDSEFADNWTAGCWVKRIGIANQQMIFNKYFKQYFQCLAGKLSVSVYDKNNAQQVDDDMGTIPLNDWVHIVVTYGEDTLKAYINGTYSDSFAALGPLTVHSDHIRIGHYNTNLYFEGILDDIRLYNRVLTAGEISTIYNSGTGTEGTIDVSSYLKSGLCLGAERSRLPDEVAIVVAGDMTLIFSNYDDKFTESDAGSIFYGTTYLGYNVDIDAGFHTDDGTTIYVDQAVLKIIDVSLNSDGSECHIVARDILHKVVDFIANMPAQSLVPVAGATNAGNGYMTEVQTKPFVTVNEDWTLTCTTPGGDGVGIFSVVGSVSGALANATSGTEFSDAATGGIKFTIYAGGVAWELADAFTFTTRQYPEWTATNPGKIIWALLTGYDYDADTQDDWHDATLELDSTQSSANTDIDYSSFQTAVYNLGTDFNLTGYINYNTNMAEALQDILLHFLGYMYADGDGKIYIRTYKPSFGPATVREFSDIKKITQLRYDRNLDNVVNSCTARYKKTATWAWSGDSETNDGRYTETNTTSIANYGERTYTFDTHWLSQNDNAIQWAVNRVVNKYGTPIIDVEFETGADALQTYLGTIIKVTDTKTGLSNKTLEVYKVNKNFSTKPMNFGIACDDADTLSWNWAFLGSSADEGDGISPQAASYDDATASDKQFCYLSQTGGEGSDPEYYLFDIGSIVLFLILLVGILF